MPSLEKDLPTIARRSYLGYECGDRLGRRKIAADRYVEGSGDAGAPRKSFRQSVHEFLWENKQWSVGVFSGVSITRDSEMMFSILAALWKNDIAGESSLSKIVSNRYYLRIISYGDKFLPFILRQLQTETAPWFVALEAITGEYEIGGQYPGNFREMAREWIDWGKKHGVIEDEAASC
jgi:hypothetical protein